MGVANPDASEQGSNLRVLFLFQTLKIKCGVFKGRSQHFEQKVVSHL